MYGEHVYPQRELAGSVKIHEDIVSPAIAAEAARLPESFHRDPADRILVATARVLGAALLTSDRRIRDAALVTTV